MKPFNYNHPFCKHRNCLGTFCLPEEYFGENDKDCINIEHFAAKSIETISTIGHKVKQDVSKIKTNIAIDLQKSKDKFINNFEYGVAFIKDSLIKAFTYYNKAQKELTVTEYPERAKPGILYNNTDYIVHKEFNDHEFDVYLRSATNKKIFIYLGFFTLELGTTLVEHSEKSKTKESVLSIFKDKSIEIIKHISKILLNEFVNYFNIKDICITVEKEFLISLIGKRLLKNGFGLKGFFSDQYKTYKSVLKAIGTDLKENGFKVSKNPDFILITEQEYYLSCLNRLAKLVIAGETTSVTYPGYMKDTPVYLVKISTKEEETKIMNLWKKYGDKNNVIKIKRVNVAENTYGITVYGNIKVSGTILQEARKQMRILLRAYISNMKNDE